MSQLPKIFVGAFVGAAVALAAKFVYDAAQEESTPETKPDPQEESTPETKPDPQEESTPDPPANYEVWYGEDRHTLLCGKVLCLGIGSCGDKAPKGFKVASKRASRAWNRSGGYTKTEQLSGVKRDMKRFQSLVRGDPNKDIYQVLIDEPGNQQPRDVYYKQVEEFFKFCKSIGAAAMIYYSGHGTEDDDNKDLGGDWVFHDTVIYLNDILGLYSSHLKGNLLYIVSDACHSGQWVIRLKQYLDERHQTPDNMIGACGHRLKDHGFAIKLITACDNNKDAFDGCFSKHVMKADETRSMYFCSGKRVRNGSDFQNTHTMDTTRIRCGTCPDLACRLGDDSTWKHMTSTEVYDLY